MIEEPQPPRPFLSYDGRLRELYVIFLVNLMMTVATLGIYRFWAQTRIRRYLWSRMSCNGQRLEYDGTGLQLFLGFVIALAILAVLFAGTAAVAAIIRPHSPALALLILTTNQFTVAVLAFGARFSAQRYRLNHTIWCGIRGGVRGSMIQYGLASLSYYLFAAVTYGQLLPFASLRLYERRINATSFGDVSFVAACRARAIYGRFFLATIGAVVLTGCVFFAVYSVKAQTVYNLTHAPTPESRDALTASLTRWGVVAIVIAVAGIAILSAAYRAAYFRHITASTTWGDLQFSSAVSGGAVLRLTAGNLALLVLTLGLGLPVILHRNARYLATNLLVTGDIHAETLRQTPQPASRFGEGMFQALDAGAGAF